MVIAEIQTVSELLGVRVDWELRWKIEAMVM